MPPASILLKIVRICHSQFKCNYLKNEKLFVNFFVPFMEATSNFEQLKKTMIIIANVFPKLQTVKNLVRPLSKRHRVWKCYDSEHGKVSQILAKSPSEHFNHFFFIILREFHLESWNARGVCWQIDCWWQVSCSILQEFATCNSNAIIWQTKNFLSTLCSISGIYIKFQTFLNKRWWS